MNAKKVYFGMVALCVLLGCSIFGSALVVSNLLRKESDRLVGMKLDNIVLDQQQTSLLQSKKTLDQNKDLDAIAKVIVPRDKDQAKTVREIVNIASQTGIKLSTISFPTSSLGQSSKTSDDTPKTTTPGGVTQVKPVEGISGLYSLEITIQSESSAPTTYPKLIDFLTKLENNRRTAQVTNVTVQPVPQNRNNLTFSLIVNTFIKP